jgi:N-acetylmuramoyl-L-alanine amidase
MLQLGVRNYEYRTIALRLRIENLELRKIVVILLSLWLAMPMDAAKTFTLVIDAGHGGHDAGAVGAMSKEKNLTLKYSLAFGKLVEQRCPDVKVIYTRTTDRFLELWQRAEVANKAKADLFISIHINALPKGRIARGYQTYALGRSRRDGNRKGYIENLEVAKRENSVILYEKDYQQHYEGFDPNSPESNILFELMQDKNMENSVQLAKLMQQYVCQATGRQDQGVHQDNLAVLRLTSMPACLLELGFISTPDEERYLNSNDALYAYASGIYNAFMAYRGKLNNIIKVPYKPETPEVEKTEVQPEKVEKPEKTETQEIPEGSVKSEKQAAPISIAPIFKVQILASDRQLKAGDSRLKDRKDATYYKEGGLYKYTIGASADYSEIQRLRKELVTSFPGAFVVAFRGDEKMDVNAAIAEWRKRK